MNKIVCSLLAAGAAAISVASPAQAEPRFEQRHEQRYDPGYSRYRYASQEWRERQWRELYRARRQFYAHWNGNPWERARFERWYGRRCAELRAWRG
jgi:hypothetical protein